MLTFPDIDPVAFAIGPLVIRWYALAYVAGILCGYGYIRRINKRVPFLSEEALDDLIPYAVLGVILGGRIGYILFYNFPYFLGHPLEMLQVWHGGMSFHGGLLGVLLSFYIFARRHRLSYMRVLDYLAAATPIGLFFGRLANFINGELFGRVTDGRLGMVFPSGGPSRATPANSSRPAARECCCSSSCSSSSPARGRCITGASSAAPSSPATAPAASPSSSCASRTRSWATCSSTSPWASSSACR